MPNIIIFNDSDYGLTEVFSESGDTPIHVPPKSGPFTYDTGSQVVYRFVLRTPDGITLKEYFVSLSFATDLSMTINVMANTQIQFISAQIAIITKLLQTTYIFDNYSSFDIEIKIAPLCPGIIVRPDILRINTGNIVDNGGNRTIQLSPDQSIIPLDSIDDTCLLNVTIEVLNNKISTTYEDVSLFFASVIINDDPTSINEIQVTFVPPESNIPDEKGPQLPIIKSTRRRICCIK